MEFKTSTRQESRSIPLFPLAGTPFRTPIESQSQAGNGKICGLLKGKAQGGEKLKKAEGNMSRETK